MHRFGVAQLMLIRGGGQRHQNRGLAGGGQFAEGAHTRPADNQIRRGKCTRHIGKKRNDFALDAALDHGQPEPRRELLVSPGTGLMNQSDDIPP